MRMSLSSVALALWVNMLGFADAAYVIKLKNGNEYVTNRYWQEGAQVLFDADGGVFGIDRAFVGKIEKTDKVIKLLTTADFSPSEKPEAALKESNNDTKEPPAGAAKTPVGRDESDPVYKEFAALKAQSDSLYVMSRGDLDEYVKRVVGLLSKIQNDRKINQYLQEYSELNALANSAEDAVKSRR